MALTDEQQQKADEKAAAAAHKEWENDPNRKDPATTQERVDKAVHALRKQMGLER